MAARLLMQADSPDPQTLLAALQQPSDQPTPLLPLLRALTLALDERRLSSPAAPVPQWLDSVADAAGSAAWDSFVTNVTSGDEASEEAAGGWLSWLDGHLGQADVNRRLQVAFEQGMSLFDFAARLVGLGMNVGTGARTIYGFTPDKAITRIGPERIARDLVTVDNLSEPTVDRYDEEDVSWRNRRVIATSELAKKFADGLPARPHVVLPTARSSAGPLLNFRPALLRAGEEPELSVRLTVLAPPDHLPPLGSASIGLEAGAREQAVLGLLEGGPLTAWLRRVAPGWHAQPSPWTMIDTDPRTRTVAQTGLQVADPAAASRRQQQPIGVAAQVLTGQAPEGRCPPCWLCPSRSACGSSSSTGSVVRVIVAAAPSQWQGRSRSLRFTSCLSPCAPASPPCGAPPRPSCPGSFSEPTFLSTCASTVRLGWCHWSTSGRSIVSRPREEVTFGRASMWRLRRWPDGGRG